MTHAELLRNHADLATREGGMYYSGEYLSRIAETAESLERENAKLREFASKAYSMAFNFYHGAGTAEDLRELKIEYHELEIEAES